MPGIQDVPFEVVLLVIGYLGTGDLAAFAQTSQKFFDLVDPVLYRVAKDTVDDRESWHPLRWAAEAGQAGTLSKALAAGVDPDKTFADEVDREMRDMLSSQLRVEATDANRTWFQPLADTRGEWIPQDDDADEVGFDPRLAAGLLDTSQFGHPGVRDTALDGLDGSDDDEHSIGFSNDEQSRRSFEDSGADDVDVDDDDTMFIFNSCGRVFRRFCAIHIAAVGGYDEFIEMLLDHGAEIDACCHELCDCRLICPRSLGSFATNSQAQPARWGETALHLAICYFHTSTARLLLARGASIWLSDPKRPTTALHSAAATGQTDLCQHLLDHGYVQDVDILDGNKLSPFYAAYFNGHWKTTVPFLLQRGANIDIQIPRDPDSLALDGTLESCTILYEAIDSGRLEDAIRLIHLGADVNKGLYTDATHKERPLHAASRPGIRTFQEPPRSFPLKLSSFADEDESLRRKLLQLMLQAGAEIDARTSGVGGLTPLHYAAKYTMAPALEILLSAGANVHVPDVAGLTALMYACLPRPPQIPPDHGASRNAEELHSIRLLLDHGSRLDATDDQGNTVLHLVCQCLRPVHSLLDITRLLLDRGAKDTVRCHSGKIPFQAAFERGGWKICDILVRRRKTVPVLQREELDSMLAFCIQKQPAFRELCDILYDLDIEASLWKSSIHVMHMIEAGCPELIWAYLRRRTPPLSPKEKSTILQAAVREGNVHAMKQMIAINAPLNLPDKDGHTPLYRLLAGIDRNDPSSLVKEFFAAGADPHYRHESGPHLTPLVRAITLNYHVIVETMLRHSPLKDSTRAPKGVYLHAAARAVPSKRMFSVLIRAGVKVTELDVNGDTPLAVFLQKVRDQPDLVLPTAGLKDTMYLTIWYLWSKDIDIVQQNKTGESVFSYLTALSLYNGAHAGRRRMATEVQKRIQIVTLPGERNGKTLKFAL